MSDEIFEFIRDQVVEVLDADPNEVRRETSLAEQFDADSIDVIEIASAVERHFNVEIEDHEVYDLANVGQFVDLVTAKAANKR